MTASSGERVRGFIAGDPLRAVAALSVLAYHAAYFAAVASHHWVGSAYGALAGPVLASLYLGLFIFFVLSGYLIAGPFVRAFVAGERLPSLRRYARNRLLRICPAFWVVLTVVLLIWGTMGASPGQLVSMYGFAQNYTNPKLSIVIGQAWTLDVEIAFYLLVPVAALLLAKACGPFGVRARRRVLVAVLVLAAIASLSARALGGGGGGVRAFAWQTALPAMLFAFIPGVLLAVLETTSAPERLWRAGSALPGVAAAALGLVIVGVSVVRGQAVTPQFLDPEGAALAAVGTGLLVGAALLGQWSSDRAWRGLDNRVMRWFGERSYSLYLVHQPVVVAIAFAIGASLSVPVALMVTLPLALAISSVVMSVSYRYVEQPFMRLRGLPRRRAIAMEAAASC